MLRSGGRVRLLLLLLSSQLSSVGALIDSFAELYGQLHQLESTSAWQLQPASASAPPPAFLLSSAPRSSAPHRPSLCSLSARGGSSFVAAPLQMQNLLGAQSRGLRWPLAGGARVSGPESLGLRMKAKGVKSHKKSARGAAKALAEPSAPQYSKPESTKQGIKVLVLNASYEPLSIVSASRALALLWENKAVLVVNRDKFWKSCGGQVVNIPSVVSLRRYVKVSPRLPALNRRTILLRDKGKCQYCGAAAENIDHVIPRCRGGGNTWDNVVASCKPCNTRKAHYLLKDTNLKLKTVPGPPRELSWVHNAVWKVDPKWKPYVGSLSWEDLKASMPPQKSKGGKKTKKQRIRRFQRNIQEAPQPEEEEEGRSSAEAEAESVINAYTGTGSDS